VVAAAVILPEKTGLLARMGLKDSKQLDRAQREKLDAKIRGLALAISVAEVDAETIDRVNIYQASRLAMRLAVEGLSASPDHLLIDAMLIDHPCAQTRLYFGDALCLSIAAASVVAKVYRDACCANSTRATPAMASQPIRVMPRQSIERRSPNTAPARCIAAPSRRSPPAIRRPPWTSGLNPASCLSRRFWRRIQLGIKTALRHRTP
jgi:hypothetical protein